MNIGVPIHQVYMHYTAQVLHIAVGMYANETPVSSSMVLAVT